MIVIIKQLLALKLKGHSLTEFEHQLLESSTRWLATRLLIRNALLQTSLVRVERDLDELQERSA